MELTPKLQILPVNLLRLKQTMLLQIYHLSILSALLLVHVLKLRHKLLVQLQTLSNPLVFARKKQKPNRKEQKRKKSNTKLLQLNSVLCVVVTKSSLKYHC